MYSHKFNAVLGVLLILPILSGSVWAQDLPQLPKNTDPQLVEEILAKKRLAQALYELEEVQKKRKDLMVTQAESSSQSNQVSAPSLSLPGQNITTARIEPVVMSIEGKADRLRALLIVGQGATQRVKSGDIANGWKIIRVEHDGVMASFDGQAKFLALGDSNYVPQSQQINTAQPYLYQE